MKRCKDWLRTFRLDPKTPTAAALSKPKHPYIRQFREDEMLCFRVLTDYLNLVEDWKARYAPKTRDNTLDVIISRLYEGFVLGELRKD